MELAGKELYTSGRYVGHFHPDTDKNPFSAIYGEKREYVVGQVRGSDLRILDLGGGMGRMTIPLAPRHRLVLADLSLSMLQLAAQSGRGFGVLNCEADTLCFKQASFDGVIAIDLIPHLSDPPRMLAEIRRVLRPNGWLITDTTNSNPGWVLGYPRYVNPFRKPVRWIRTILGGGVPPEWQGRIHHLSQRQFGQLLGQSGFKVLDWKSFGPWWCPKWFVARCELQ